MEKKYQKLLKYKTWSNKIAKQNNNSNSATTLILPVKFRIKKKKQHDPA
jgi:hypothetical protein